MTVVHAMRTMCLLYVLTLLSCEDTISIKKTNSQGTVIEEYNITNDSIKHGSYFAYYENGKLKESSHYENGLLTGERNFFYQNGAAEIIEKYDSHGQLNGPYFQYFENGKLMLEKTYVSNKLSGLLKIYYANGKIKEEVTMVDNEENGPFTEYHENGKIHWKGQYRNGDHEYGVLQEFDSTGILIKVMKCDTSAICSTIWKSGMAAINPDTIAYD